MVDLLDQAAQEASIWEEEPMAAYMKMLGIEGTGRNPYQQWQLSQFAPTRGAYLAQEALAPSPEGTSYFGDYMRKGGILGARRAAPDLFKQLTALPWEQQESALTNIGDYLDSLMANVFGARYGRRAGRSMASNLPIYEQAYIGPGGGYAGEDTFLNYLRQKYNL